MSISVSICKSAFWCLLFPNQWCQDAGSPGVKKCRCSFLFVLLTRCLPLPYAMQQKTENQTSHNPLAINPSVRWPGKETMIHGMGRRFYVPAPARCLSQPLGHVLPYFIVMYAPLGHHSCPAVFAPQECSLESTWSKAPHDCAHLLDIVTFCTTTKFPDAIPIHCLGLHFLLANLCSSNTAANLTANSLFLT